MLTHKEAMPEKEQQLAPLAKFFQTNVPSYKGLLKLTSFKGSAVAGSEQGRKQNHLSAVTARHVAKCTLSH